MSTATSAVYAFNRVGDVHCRNPRPAKANPVRVGRSRRFVLTRYQWIGSALSAPPCIQDSYELAANTHERLIRLG